MSQLRQLRSGAKHSSAVATRRSARAAGDSADANTHCIGSDTANHGANKAARVSAPKAEQINASGARASARIVEWLAAWFAKGARVVAGRVLKPRRRRKLQLLEMQQLGEKRFVAIVQIGKQKFLIGGASSSVSLLAEIDARHAKAIAPRPVEPEEA